MRKLWRFIYIFRTKIYCVIYIYLFIHFKSIVLALFNMDYNHGFLNAYKYTKYENSIES